MSPPVVVNRQKTSSIKKREREEFMMQNSQIFGPCGLWRPSYQSILHPVTGLENFSISGKLCLTSTTKRLISIPWNICCYYILLLWCQTETSRILYVFKCICSQVTCKSFSSSIEVSSFIYFSNTGQKHAKSKQYFLISLKLHSFRLDSK